MRFIVLAALAASAVAAPAVAQTVEPSTGFKPVASVSAGFSRFVDGSEEFNGGALSGRATVRFHRNFGIEADASLGLETSDIAGLEFKMNHNIATYAVGYWPISDNADLIGRIGYGASEFEVSDGVVSASETFSGVTAGIGGQYFFDDKNGLRMDVTRHHYEDLDGGIDSVSLMYVRNF
jgi:outer membrane immunogenic protein